MSKARREVLRHALKVERLARRHRRRLGDEAADALQVAAREAGEAALGENAEKLSGAVKRLDGLFDKHLAFTRRGLLREYGEVVVGAVLVTLLVRAFVLEPYRMPSSSMVPTLVAGDHVAVNKLAYGPRIPFTSRRVLTLGTPARGDVVVFSSPREPERDFVKRVVGLPGDVVEIRDGTVWVNGVPQPRTPAGELTYEELNESTGRWWRDTCLVFNEKLAQGAIPPPREDGEGALKASWAAGAAGGLITHGVLQCRRTKPLPHEGPFQTVATGHVFVLGDNRDRSADSRTEGGWQVPFDNIAGKAILVWWSWGRGGLSPLKGEGVRVERLFKRIE